MASIFRRDIEPSCSYCLHGTNIGQGEIACRNHGIMSAAASCSAFVYEPTKRMPEYATKLNTDNLADEDFSIS